MTSASTWATPFDPAALKLEPVQWNNRTHLVP